MPYTRYRPEQIAYLKKYYTRQTLAELALALGIETPRKVLELARRHGIRKRAFNGAPQWRYPIRS